jgi:hypothetical protein
MVLEAGAGDVVVVRLLEGGIGVHLRLLLRLVGEVHLHPQHCRGRRRRHHPSLPHPRSSVASLHLQS